MPGPGPHYREGDPRNEMSEAEAIAYSESHPRTATPCPQTLTDLLARTEKQVPSTENPVVAALRAREAAHLSELADYGRTVTVLRARVEELEAAIHGAATSLGNAEAEIARLREQWQDRPLAIGDMVREKARGWALGPVSLLDGERVVVGLAGLAYFPDVVERVPDEPAT